jgi:ParB/RepB/Spo0J family partition protein
MPKLESKPLAFFKPDVGQARQTYDESELRLLGESLKERQLQPVLARPDGTIIAGNRRYRAAALVGLESLQVIIVEGELTTAQVRGIQLTENIHRSDLTPYEKWQACKELLDLNGWQGKELAEHLHLDPSTVTRLLSPSRAIPEAQEALREGKLGISDIYAISKLPPEDQCGLLALKLSGATRDMLEQQGRKKRASAAPTVRASKIKVPLVTGQIVTVAGDEISLEEAIEAASEAVKQMKQAVAKGLIAKTAMNVWKDIAAAS